MKMYGMIVFLLAIFISGCQSDMDEMYGRNAVTDAFILVDCYSGVYKFVQIDNEYTIGVDEGLLQIPDDFHEFTGEDVCSYYKVNLKITGLDSKNGTILYQRFTGNSATYLIKQASTYEPVDRCVRRVEFFNDYLYYIMD